MTGPAVGPNADPHTFVADAVVRNIRFLLGQVLRRRPCCRLAAFAYLAIILPACAVKVVSPIDIAVTRNAKGPTCGQRSEGVTTGSILPPGKWKLVVDDEFDCGALNRTLWYTPPDNSIQNGTDLINDTRSLSFSNGMLVMSQFTKPNGEENGGGEITSNQGFGPGYYEARINPGTGWSVFWILGGNYSCAGDRTQGFEADILENVSAGGQNNTHWGGYGACHESAGQQNLGLTGFHTIGLLWDLRNGLTYYADGKVTFHLPGPAGGVYPAKLKLTVAGLSSAEPFMIDWVRYYQSE